MDNSQDKELINKTAVALVASQIFIKRAADPESGRAFDLDATIAIESANIFVDKLKERGYDPGALLTGLV